MAKDRQLYETPAVHRRISIEPEGDILAGSIVDNMTGNVTSTGQGYTDYDGSTFSHNWE